MATYTERELNEQLLSIQEVLAVARACGDPPDRASQISLRSILREESRLLGELKVLEMEAAKAAAELVLDGDPVRDHAISISFLGQLLTKIQDLTNSVAHAQIAAQTARGNLPMDVIARNRFRLAGIFESSFGIVLRLPDTERTLDMFNSNADTPADTVCRLLNTDDLSPGTISMLSGPRVRSHYASLVELLAKNGASITFRTRKLPLGSRMSAEQARDRSSWLDQLVIEDETITVRGNLVGGSIEGRRFEIKIEEIGEIFRGSTTEAAANQMRRLTFGSYVSAQIKAITSTHEEAEIGPRTSYDLLHLELVTPPQA